MGHKRKGEAPSPIKLLSIFEALRRGVSVPEISERTLFSKSSIGRWNDKWGDEEEFLRMLFEKCPEARSLISFEILYPKRRNSVPAVDLGVDSLAPHLSVVGDD